MKLRVDSSGVVSSLLAAVFALVVCLLLPESSRAGPPLPKSSVEPEKYHRDFGYLPLKDGTQLAYVVWRPKKQGRYPTLLIYGPYFESGLGAAAGSIYGPVVRLGLTRGYAVVGVNTRGTGCSEGTNDYLFAVEGRDGAEAVEWLAAQPWSTGKVGMLGLSSPGYTEIETAANHPPHLKAIAPGGLTASDYREVWMVGGMVQQELISDWSYILAPHLQQMGVDARMGWGDARCAAIRAKQPPVRSIAYGHMLEHPFQDAYWEARSLESFIGAVTVPTFIFAAWQDEWEISTGAVRLFTLLNAPHKRITFQNGGHSSSFRDIDLQQLMRWMDHWLKGVNNGIDTEQPVTVFWEVTETKKLDELTIGKPGWVTSYPSWPVPNLKWLTFFLTPNGDLSREPARVAADHAERSYLYPTGTELVGTNAQFALEPYPLGTLSYRTEAASADMTILGSPQLTFYVSATQKDTDFLVTLKDIDPSGNVLFLQRGFLRASLRAVDPARSTPEAVVQSFRTPEELVPGQVYKMQLSLGAVGHVVRAGHRLELSILAPSPIPQPGPGMGPVIIGLPSTNTVYQSADYPSALALPIVPDETAKAPPPDCGVLLFQPCRKPPPTPPEN